MFIYIHTDVHATYIQTQVVCMLVGLHIHIGSSNACRQLCCACELCVKVWIHATTNEAMSSCGQIFISFICVGLTDAHVCGHEV